MTRHLPRQPGRVAVRVYPAWTCLALILTSVMAACGNSAGVPASAVRSASSAIAPASPAAHASRASFVAASAQQTISLADATLVLSRPSRPVRPSVSASPAASLSGQYAFSFNGADTNGLLQIAGSFQADGQGNISNGIEDVNAGDGVVAYSGVTGTYTVGQDGRGSLTLSTTAGPQNFQITVLSSARALIIRFDTLANGIGSIELQDASAFTNAALSGPFVAALNGDDFSLSSSGTPVSAIERLVLDGAGNVSSGSRDENDDGTVSLNSTFTGSYSVAANGRGTATLTDAQGTSHFAFYVVSARKIVLISTDVLVVWLGSAQAQQGLSSTALTGPYVYSSSGLSTLGSIAEAAQFTVSTGSSSLTGTGDQNNAGGVTAGFALAGFYSADSNGHGTLALTSSSLGTANYAFYELSPAKAMLLRTDSTVVMSGTLFQQQSSAFSAASISGSYGFNGSGASGAGAMVKVGQLTADGSGNYSGAEAVDDGGTLATSIALLGTYTVSSAGRASLSLSEIGVNRALGTYLISPSQMLLIGLDTDQVLSGEADSRSP